MCSGSTQGQRYDRKRKRNSARGGARASMTARQLGQEQLFPGAIAMDDVSGPVGGHGQPFTVKSYEVRQGKFGKVAGLTLDDGRIVAVGEKATAFGAYAKENPTGMTLRINRVITKGSKQTAHIVEVV